MGDLAILGGERAVPQRPSSKQPRLGRAERERVDSLLQAGAVSPHSAEFKALLREAEERFSAFFGVPHCVFCTSGTAALLLANIALDFGPGDEVIVPAYTYPATITPLFLLGADVVLADVDPATFNVSPESVRKCVNSRTCGVIVTHMRGHPVDLAPVLDFARPRGIAVVEDASHAFGSTYNGRRVGGLGQVGCLSMSTDKLVSGGILGVALTGDRDLAETMRLAVSSPARFPDAAPSNLSALQMAAEVGLGINFHPSTLSLALATSQMEQVEARIQARGERLARLTENLAEFSWLEPPRTADNCTRGGWYGYRPLYLPEKLAGLPRGRFVEVARAEGVPVSLSGIRPFYRYPGLRCPEAVLRLTSRRCRELSSNLDPQSYPGAEYVYAHEFKIAVTDTPDFEALCTEYRAAFRKIEAKVGSLPACFFAEEA